MRLKMAVCLMAMLGIGLFTDLGTAKVRADDDVTAYASPTLLWPPNHKFVTVTVTLQGGTIDDDSDNGEMSPAVIVYSNQGELAKGSGNFKPDAQNFKRLSDTSFSIDLRAERAGSGGNRAYLIVVRVKDGKSDTPADEADTNHQEYAAVGVAVPHDHGKANWGSAATQASDDAKATDKHYGTPPLPKYANVIGTFD